MILDIHERLQNWAVWVLSGRHINGLGFPSQCAFSRLTPSASIHNPTINDSAWQTEKAVHQLPKAKQRIIKEFYIKPGTVYWHCRALHISKTKLYAELDSIHREILYFLSER